MIPEGRKINVKAARYTKVSRNYYIQKRKETPHMTALLTKEKVIKFLKDTANSTCLPGKGDVIKVGKGVGNKKRIYVLNDTLYNLFIKYKTANNCKISFSTFTNCRPKNIRCVDYTNRAKCLCRRHQNMQLKLSPLFKLGIRKKISEVMRLYTDEELKQHLSLLEENEVIHFEEWKQVKTKTKKGNEKVEWKLKSVNLDKENFIDQFMNDIKDLREHSARVKAIFEGIHELTKNLRDDEVVLHMDFSKNYECIPLDETADHYFNRDQVTLHPMVIYYKNTEENETENKSYCGVTDSKDHRATEAITFCQSLLKNISQDLGRNISKIHYVSDSPQKQYRNKTMSYFIMNHKELTGMEASYTYLEVGHGKSVCDAVGGNCKRSAVTAVKCGEKITNAEEFYDWAKNSKSLIKYFWCSVKEMTCMEKVINRWNKPTVFQIMKKHALVVKNGDLFSRETPCWSECCYSDGKFILNCDGWVKFEG